MDLLVFPHQLFQEHPGLKPAPDRVVLIEDSLFFGDWHYPARFHQQKLWLHRASMKRYQRMLEDRGFQTVYRDHLREPHSLQQQLAQLTTAGDSHTRQWRVLAPVDHMLEKRLARAAQKLGAELETLPTPGFLNQSQENAAYREGKNRWFMADFYQFQRRRLEVLMEGDQPTGGKWSFDHDNRKKIPKADLGRIPELAWPEFDDLDQAARQHVLENYPDNPGSLEKLYYPTSHESAATWLEQFFEQRFVQFGAYEDAMEPGERWLWHSVLTPMLNTGLLTPRQVLDAALAYSSQHDIPLNSLEGFVRQIIGWREFIRATYEDLGVTMRNGNHWEHHRSLPRSFYDASTGIAPIDDTVARLLHTGYCHHIERLMVLGGFLFLCEVHPDEIYRWFMEMFVDSYDWVMVPNVYAMSQHAAGGLITTKPYFSGSSYIRKMSHYPKGDWCEVWDGLYWRWIWNHRDALRKNPRWAMMCSMVEKMDDQKRGAHLKAAESFLETLDASG